jgi:hypothetical protein
MFTDEQMYAARDSNKFKTHRDFVAWMFLKQHKCIVEDHALLKYRYVTVKGVNVIKVEGQMGQGLLAK